MASEIRSISELAYTSPWASKIRSDYITQNALAAGNIGFEGLGNIRTLTMKLV